MGEIKRLLNKTPINEGETLSSFLVRLMKVNYYDAPYTLMESEHFTRHEFLTNQIPKEICEQLEVLSGENNLYRYSYKSLDVSQRQENLLFVKSRSKYCSNCLSENIYQKFSWGLNLISVCEKHRVFLLQECKQCQGKVDVFMIMKDECKSCGQRLSKLTCELVENPIVLDSQIELLDVLEGKKEKFLEEFQLITLLEVIKAFSYLLNGLKSFIQTSSVEDKTTYRVKSLTSQKTVTEIVADIYWLFTNFDERFPLILVEFFQQHSIEIFRKRKRKFKKAIIAENKLHFILEAYQEYRLMDLKENNNIPQNSSMYDVETVNFIKNNYFTINQLKAQYGLASSEIEFLMTKGELKNSYFFNGKTRYFYKNQTSTYLEVYLMKKKDRINQKDGAKLLGVSIERLRALIDQGYLTLSEDHLKRKYLSKEQIRKFVKSLNVQKTISIENMISFSECIKRYTSSGLSVNKLIELILTDKVTPYAVEKEHVIDDLYFDSTNLAAALKEDRTITRGYTLEQVALKVDCSQQTILKLVEANLIQKPTIEKINKKVFSYRFHVENIERFNEEFYTVNRLVKEYRVSNSLIRNAVYRGSLKNYLKGKCKKIIISKKDFEEYMKQKK